MVDDKVQECWQESLFMSKLMKTAVAFTSISFLLSFQTPTCNCKHEVYFLSTLFFSVKTSLLNSLLQFCHALYLPLLFLALRFCFSHYCQEDWLSILLYGTEILKLLKRYTKVNSHEQLTWISEAKLRRGKICSIIYWFFHTFHKQISTAIDLWLQESLQRAAGSKSQMQCRLCP